MFRSPSIFKSASSLFLVLGVNPFVLPSSPPSPFREEETGVTPFLILPPFEREDIPSKILPLLLFWEGGGLRWGRGSLSSSLPFLIQNPPPPFGRGRTKVGEGRKEEEEKKKKRISSLILPLFENKDILSGLSLQALFLSSSSPFLPLSSIFICITYLYNIFLSIDKNVLQFNE